MASKVKRRPAAKKVYWWFQGASVRDLYDQLGLAGPDTVRLEVRIDAQKRMTFDVKGGRDVETESHAPWHTINDSHLCPPSC